MSKQPKRVLDTAAKEALLLALRALRGVTGRYGDMIPIAVNGGREFEVLYRGQAEATE